MWSRKWQVTSRGSRVASRSWLAKRVTCREGRRERQPLGCRRAYGKSAPRPWKETKSIKQGLLWLLLLLLLLFKRGGRKKTNECTRTIPVLYYDTDRPLFSNSVSQCSHVCYGIIQHLHPVHVPLRRELDHSASTVQYFVSLGRVLGACNVFSATVFIDRVLVVHYVLC